MANGPRRTSGFLPGGLAAMAAQRASEKLADPRFRGLRIGMPYDPYTSVVLNNQATADELREVGVIPFPSAAEAARQSVVARKRRQSDIMKAYGLGAPSKLPQPDVAAPTSTGIADTVAGYLPETGTPEMAGLGAAGRTMIQLGGWQDRPYTLGQILGAGAEKGLEAMKARQDAMTAAAEKKAAAEQKAKEFALEERYKEAQIEELTRKKEQQPLSAAAKYATDLGYKIGTKEHAEAMRQYSEMTSKKKESTALQQEAEMIFPNDKEAQAAWIKDRREKPRGYIQKAGVVLDENGNRVGRAIFNPTPKEGEGYVSVIDDKGKTRALAEGERSVEDSLIKEMVIPQQQYYQLRRDVLTGAQGIRKLKSYLSNIKDTKEGVARTADQFIAMSKVFFSSVLPEKYKKMTKSQLATAIASGELQGLIGASRLEVVGGGVMTEQDALRIIGYLGQDVTSTQSKEVVEAQIKKILREKAENHNLLALQYNEQSAFRGGKTTPVSLIDMNQFEGLNKKPQTDQSAKADEIARRLLGMQ